MDETTKWRDGVTVIRGDSLDRAMRGPSGTGRATAFEFAGTGGQQTWIGAVTLKAKAKTGMHHHGRHEVALYVIRGRTEVRWGERLEYLANVGAGDYVYFAPYVPHEEHNPSGEPVDFLVVRSDNERIVVSLDGTPVEQPEIIF